jgi:hypothetical protein
MVGAAALPGVASSALDPKEKHATLEEYAALDFEPWKHVGGEWTPPKPKEWAELFNPYGVTIRVAWEIAHKTKAQLTEIVKATTEEDGRDLMQGFIDTKNFLEGALAFLGTAEVRYLCAGSTVELEEGGANDV